jgi:hypothetical protein
LTEEESNEVESGTKYLYPFLDRISEIGFDKYWSDSECQKLLFCEMAEKGGADGQDDDDQSEANMVQKVFNYVAIL